MFPSGLQESCVILLMGAVVTAILVVILLAQTPEWSGATSAIQDPRKAVMSSCSPRLLNDSSGYFSGAIRPLCSTVFPIGVGGKLGDAAILGNTQLS